MRKNLSTGLKWVLDLVLTFIGLTLLGQSLSFIANIANLSQLTASESVRGAIGLFAIVGAVILFTYLVITRNNRKVPRAERKTSDTSDLEKASIRTEQFRKVTADLDAHYKGLIDRMDGFWDYQPKDSGEQIFTKGTTPGPALGQFGLGPPYSREIPQNLEQDKKHLKEFREPWDLYSNGPVVCAKASGLEEQAKQLVKEYLTSPLNEVEPPYRLIDRFTGDIVDRVDSKNRGQYVRDFEATMMGVQGPFGPLLKYPAIDLEILDALSGPSEAQKWSLPRTQKLADIMNATTSKQDVRDIVGKRREAWDAVSKNKTDFLARLREGVISRAKSSNYQITELTEGVCDDCRPLKEKHDSLLGPKFKPQK